MYYVLYGSEIVDKFDTYTDAVNYAQYCREFYSDWFYVLDENQLNEI